MRSSKTLKKICAVAMVSVLSAAFAFSSAACSHKHTFSDEWTTDETYHWHVAKCHENVVSDKKEHEFGTDDICDVCNYDRSTGTTNPSDPSNPNNPANPSDPTAQSVTISFDSKGGSTVGDQTINTGDKLQKPATPEKPNYMFAGWYTNEACTTPYDFNKAVTGGFTLYAKWVELNAAIKSYKGYNESLAVEWTGEASSSIVKYKEATASAWKTLDAPLVRNMGGGLARADVIGLAEGDYNVKIEGSSTIELPAPISVTAYDRSGYAHFNYTDGVGAYTDDGELKEGALVIYVTDTNKNDISDSVYKNTANGLVKEDISQYFWTDPNGQVQKGIGYLLNNRQYSKSDRENYGIQKLSFKYGAVAIRILGEVIAEDPEVKSNPESSLVLGLTAYDSTDFGGTAGDNGRMARMVNAKNITIEGVGEDTLVWGWGFHFVSNDNLHEYEGSGKSFEARNLTFQSYPEDALGMEGTVGTNVDATGSITSGASSANSPFVSPVERCWIHNNTFFQGGCANAAESDKKEGDGSCDIKRGQYFTVSYNYYEGCHKTNLIGNGDNAITYNYSMHHNWWYNCKARMPLVRRANIHYYNNYILADDNPTVQAKGLALSDVISARANSYMLCEANYFNGSKVAIEIQSGAAVKSYGNVFNTCWYKENDDGVGGTQVTSRTEKVSNSCKYLGGDIDYTEFDTNPELFYYDAVNQKSDCFIEDAVTARKTVMMRAGANGDGKSLEETYLNEKTPTSAVPVPDDGTLDVAIPTAKGDTTVNGVIFSFTGSGKGKGQIATFTLATEAEISVTTTTTGTYAPEIYGADGTQYARKFTGKLSLTLPAGTFFITTGEKDKEATITALSFASTANSAQIKIDTLNAAIDAIPDPVTIASESLVTTAQVALAALNADQLAAYQTENAARLQKLNAAITALENAKIANVESLINAIGTVDDNSYTAIKDARDAYNKLTEAQKAKVTNLATLTAAEEAWESRAITAINNQIAALTDVSAWTVANGKDAITAKKTEYEAVKSAYEALSSNEGVINYSKVTDGIAKLDSLLAEITTAEANAAKLADFKEALAAITDVENSTLAQLSPVVAKYEALGALKDNLTPDEASKYALIVEKVEAATPASITLKFNGSLVSTDTEQAGISNIKVVAYEGASATIDGVSYSKAVKLKGGALEFTLNADYTIKFYMKNAKVVLIDGEDSAAPAKENASDNYYVLTVTLKAGSHTISHKKDSNDIFVMKLTKVAKTSTASILDGEIDLVEAKSNED